jgi:hypothetical protein
MHTIFCDSQRPISMILSAEWFSCECSIAAPDLILSADHCCQPRLSCPKCGTGGGSRLPAVEHRALTSLVHAGVGWWTSLRIQEQGDGQCSVMQPVGQAKGRSRWCFGCAERSCACSFGQRIAPGRERLGAMPDSLGNLLLVVVRER